LPRDPVPEVLVAARPEIPGVAPHNFFRRKLDAAIHRFENIGGNLRKIGGRFSGRLRVVDWLVFLAAAERQHGAANDAGSDSSETEKIATGGWQQHLHRVTIDTLLANRVARKFQSVGLNFVRALHLSFILWRVLQSCQPIDDAIPPSYWLESLLLKNIEQTLTNREDTQGTTGNKNCANKRLLSQRREGARLKVADFGDELIECLPFRFGFPTQQTKSP